uniref:beta-N-acetylhexosaminidase n=1 Tax=Ananas comosus var. bracteatus TaxID=296719 RepID=A0A6V7QC44_ANACO|nr:unnamed protein product [Ananas comosus var. bracteatus]
MQYTPDDVKTVVEFGMGRGVRVMPEIDAPAHTGSWAGAHPDIVTCANMFWVPNGVADWPNRLAAEPGTGQLNPLKSETYDVFRNIAADVASLFPEQLYHAGADEVAPGCWKADSSIQAFLAAGGTLSQLLELFVSSTHSFVLSLNRTVVEDEAKLVLGGEVALWSEQADSTVLDGRIWPRASAMAEALWSGNRTRPGGRVRRGDRPTERLAASDGGEGIRAEPIQPLWCRTRPGMCNTT